MTTIPGRRARWRVGLVAVLVAMLIATLAPAAPAELTYTRPTIPTDEFQIVDLPAFASWLTHDGTNFAMSSETDVGAQFDEFGPAPGETFDASQGVFTNPVTSSLLPATISESTYGDFDNDGLPEIAYYDEAADRVVSTTTLEDGLTGNIYTTFASSDLDPAVVGPVVAMGSMDGHTTATNNVFWLATAKGRLLLVSPTDGSVDIIDLSIPAGSTVLDAASRSRLDREVLEPLRPLANTTLGFVSLLVANSSGLPTVRVDSVRVNTATGALGAHDPGIASSIPWKAGAGQLKLATGGQSASFVTSEADPREGYMTGAVYAGEFCRSTDPERTPDFDFEIYTPRDTNLGPATGNASQLNVSCAADAGVSGGLRQITVDQVHRLSDGEGARTTRTFPGSVSTSAPVKISETVLDFPCAWLRVEPPPTGGSCSTGTNFARTETLVHYKTAAGLNAVMVASMSPGNSDPKPWSYRLGLQNNPTSTVIPMPPLRNRVRIQLDDKDVPEIMNGNPRPLVVLASPPYVRGAGQVPLAGPTYNKRETNGGSETSSTSNSVFASFGIDADFGSLVAFSAMETFGNEVGTDVSEAYDVTSNEQFVGSPNEDVVVYDAPTFFRYRGTIVESSMGVGLNTRTNLDIPRSNVVSSATFPELQRRFPAQFGTGADKGSLSNILTHTVGNPGTYKTWGATPSSSSTVSNYCDGASFDEPGTVPRPAADENQGYPFGAADNPFAKPELKQRDLTGHGILASEKHQVQTGTDNSEGAGFSITSSQEMSRSSTMTIGASVATRVVAAGAEVGAEHTWGQSWTTNFSSGVDFLAYVGHIPTDLPLETYDWRIFLCKKKLAGGLPVYVLNYTVDDYHGSGGLEELGTLTASTPKESVKTTPTPTFDFGYDSGTIRSFGLELEAVGTNDVRSVEGLETIASHIEAKNRPKNVSISWAELNQSTPLKQNQLYRWRSSAVDFFENETVSDWEFFVTDGKPANPELTVSSLTPSVNESVTLTASHSPTSAPTQYTFDLGDGRIVGPSSTATLTRAYTVAGVYQATVTMTNSYGSSTATRTISVGPKALPESYTLTEDTPLNVSAADGVMANDDGAESVRLSAAPANGTVVLQPDGAFSFTPSANACGDDAFSYSVRANGSTRFAQTTLHVTCVNDKPVGKAATFDGYEDQTLGVGSPGVLAGAVDVEGATITAVKKSNPTKGALTLRPDGSFDYVPQANACGSDSFTWAPSDGTEQGSTVTTTIVLTCFNDTPTTAAAQYGATEDTTLRVPTETGLVQYADDVEDPTSSLTFFKSSGPSHGTATVGFDGSFTYTPEANWCGSDEFSFSVTDNGGAVSAPATVTIPVACVNDVPTATDRSYNAAVEDTTLTVDAATGLLVGAADVEGSSLSAARKTNAANGSVSVQPDGSFTYVPNANFCGADSFTFTVSDGTATSVARTATIAVSCTSDVPIAGDDSFNALDATALSVAKPGVLANDTDADGEALSVTPQSVTTALGALALNADGSFTYTPKANVDGTDSFSYTVHDTTGAPATATLRVVVKRRTTLTASRARITYSSRTRTYSGTVSATLRTPSRTAISGQTIQFVVNGAPFCSAVTNTSGVATCTAPVTDTNTRLYGLYVAKYAGNERYASAESAVTAFGTSSRPPR